MEKNSTGSIWEEKSIKESDDINNLGLSNINKLREKRKKYLESIANKKI